ncbi:CHAD domain-containing protein [Pokkaliibacter sp. MBI-7]|uniref:CHAD domain-containing protein n=1 Tax=Pokkaliibacter sp. MBI-7 TaxID=3040600 RepID=UPI00244798B1|nr:CHAD domain-containing protein [Pokkaliibacter sp. MBI-7]MDH2434111.1 CHAD domain-containing protein [Pokkaliibacter sp. MBI-7]
MTEPQHPDIALWCQPFCQQQWQRACQFEPDILQGSDSEALHQYRVSLRKTRAILGLYRAHLPASLNQLRRPLSQIMAKTNRLRDLDVFLASHSQCMATLDTTHHAGINAFFTLLGADRDHAHQQLVHWLTGKRYARQRQQLQYTLSSTAAPAPFSATLLNVGKALIWQHYQQVCIQTLQVSEHSADHAIHQLRIDCKKLRYALDMLPVQTDARAEQHSTTPPGTNRERKRKSRLLAGLKGLQEDLGQFNDLSVQQLFINERVQHYQQQGEISSEIQEAVDGLLAALASQLRQKRQLILTQLAGIGSATTYTAFAVFCQQRPSSHAVD